MRIHNMGNLTERELGAIEAAGCLLQDLYEKKKCSDTLQAQYEAECYHEMLCDYHSGMAKIYEHQEGGNSGIR